MTLVSGGAGRRAEAEGGVVGASSPAPVLGVLAHGRWTTLAHIAETLGWPRRSVEKAVEILRLGGWPVIGSDEGVKLSDDAREVRAYAEDRRRRLVSISKGTRALLATARRMEGPQTTLWETAA